MAPEVKSGLFVLFVLCCGDRPFVAVRSQTATKSGSPHDDTVDRTSRSSQRMTKALSAGLDPEPETIGHRERILPGIPERQGNPSPLLGAGEPGAGLKTRQLFDRRGEPLVEDVQALLAVGPADVDFNQDLVHLCLSYSR